MRRLVARRSCKGERKEFKLPSIYERIQRGKFGIAKRGVPKEPKRIIRKKTLH